MEKKGFAPFDHAWIHRSCPNVRQSLAIFVAFYTATASLKRYKWLMQIFGVLCWFIAVLSLHHRGFNFGYLWSSHALLYGCFRNHSPLPLCSLRSSHSVKCCCVRDEINFHIALFIVSVVPPCGISHSKCFFFQNTPSWCCLFLEHFFKNSREIVCFR